MAAPRRLVKRLVIRTVRSTVRRGVKAAAVGAVAGITRERLIDRNRAKYGPEPRRRT